MTAQQTDAAQPHSPCPLSLSEFARRAGRARSTITELFQGPLAEARLAGGRADAAHPVVVAWCAARGVEHAALVAVVASVPVASAPRPIPRAPAPAAPAASRAPLEHHAPAGRVDASELADMTVRQIVATHGSVSAFADFVALKKDIAATHRIELQNWETEGQLISRDLVRLHVFGAIENANRRLLNDSPQTLALRISGAVKAGASIEEIKLTIRDHISQQLAAVKTTASRILRGQSKVDGDG